MQLVYDKNNVMFEKYIEELKEKRKILNQSDSFDEITKIWNEIKQTYEKCEIILKDISNALNNLENENEEIELKDMKFNKAFERINLISEEISKTEIENMPSLIKEMKTLKSFCLKKLEEEKVNMEEIKS